jgi:hypothetical protein
LLAGLTLAACAATPEVEVPLPDTPTSIPTQPTPLPTPVALASPMPTPSPTPLVTPTPVISFNIFKIQPYIWLDEPKALTTSFSVSLQNLSFVSSPETRLYIFDGDPQTGGDLIVDEIFPSVPPADENEPSNAGGVFKQITWDVRGQAGDHEFFYYLCLTEVVPSVDRCWAWQRTLSIPRFVWSIEILNGKEAVEFEYVKVQNRFERGETVLIRVYAANLTANETFAFTMTPTLYKDTPLQQTLATENVTLPPGQMFEQVYEHDTTNLPGTGARIFLDLDGLQSQFPTLTDRTAWEKSTSFTFPFDAYFTAEPLSGTAPLTVTFVDQSVARADGYPFDSWLWSFGDGLTSTERFPTHTYTGPGRYTVALTTTAIGNNLWTVQELLRTKGISGHLATQTFIYTYTRPGYIEVLPPDGN